MSTGLVVAAYNFDQGSGNVLTDVSGNGNNGTITNASWVNTGKYGGALSFSGTVNSLVTIADSPSLHLTSGMTLEAWIKPTSLSTTSGWIAPLAKGRLNATTTNTSYALNVAHGLGTTPSADVLVGTTDQVTTSSSAVPLSWNLLAATYDGSRLRLYLNGVQVGVTNIAGNIGNTTDPLRIGGAGANEMFSGLIDNVRIYNVALSQAAIKSDMYTAVSTSNALPSVVAVSPVSGATGVSTVASTTITFGGTIDPSTVNSSTVQLLGPSNTVVSATVSYNIATHTATLTPKSALAAGTTYTVVIRGGSGAVLKDTAGNSLAANFSSSFTTYAPPVGLVAAYNFDQGSGSVLTDVSGNGNNGTITNASWVTGLYGGALSFSGAVNSLVTIADSSSLHLGSGMTLEAWIKPTTLTSSSGWITPLAKGSLNATTTNTSFALDAAHGPGTTPSAAVLVGNSDRLSQSSSALPLSWNFLAATYDGSLLHLYLNGVQVGATSVSGNIVNTTDPLRIGGAGANEMFSGLVDNVRIYNGALSQAAIQSDMHTAVSTSNAVPSVVAVSPANGATGVSSGASATITFGGAIDPSTVNSSSVQLLGPSNTVVAATVSYTIATHTATVTPNSALAAGVTYTVLVHGGTSGSVLKDTARNPLAANFSSTFTILTINAPPVASAGPNIAGNEGSAITFAGSVTGGAGALSYLWNFGDGTTTTGTLTPSHVYSIYGSYTATLTVTDSLGQSSTSSAATVTVNDVAPIINMGGPYSGLAGTAISLTASASDPSPQEVAAGFHYSWNFGDGSGTSTLQSPSHTYSHLGTYTVTLTVTDEDGVSSTATTTVQTSLILDDSQAGYSESGANWAGAAISSAWNRQERYNAGAAVGTATATWQIGQVPIGTQYLVQVSYDAVSSRCTAALYNIYDGGTLVASVTVNQTQPPAGPTINGVLFQTLTNVVSTSGTITVTVTNEGPGAVVADAVRLAVPGSSPTATLTGSSVSAGSTQATVSFGNQQGGTVPYTYSYDFGNTGTFEIANTNSATATVPPSYVQTPGTLTVHGRITDHAGNYTDYTTTVNIGAPVSGPLVLDDSGSSFSVTGSGWAGTANAAAWNGELSYNAQAAIGAASATWQTNQVQIGVEYLVQASWAPASSDCSAAVYRVYDGDTLVATATVNQTLAPAGPTYNGVAFQTLTTIVPCTGAITVTVTSEATGALIADAIRIAPPGSPPTARLNGSTVGAGSSFASVSFSNQQGGTAPYTYSYDFGNTGTFEVSNTSNASVIIPQSYVANAGTLVVRGRIMDSLGDYSDYTANVIVSAQGYITTPYLSIPDFGASPTIVSIQSGNWSNPSTWSLGRVPTAGDVVDINAGTTVTYDVNDTADAAPLNTVEVKSGGTLTFSTTANTLMYVVNLVVLQGGELDIGTQANPMPANLTATVVWVNQPLNTTFDPEQYGNGLIVLGTMNTYGAVKVPYLTLAQNANAGDTVLHLASPATGWQAGDKLQLPDTRQLDTFTNLTHYVSQAESMTIQSISPDGLTVTLSAPLQFSHLGQSDPSGAIQFMPQVVDMTRNVSIHSQSATGTRGYALFTARANVNINYTSFGGMGRTTINTFNNSNFSHLFDNTTFDANGNVTHVGTNEGNRNAITFLNLIGPTTPQADGYQFTFNGNVVTCPLTPMPFIWGINVVNSYYGLIQNNDVVNWAGSGVMVDGLSSFNNFNGNFVMKVNGTGQRGAGDQGLGGEGFWFGNPKNYVTNNTVTDLLGNGPYTYGFEYYAIAGASEIGEGYVNIPAYQGADPSQPGQSVSVDMNLTPILSFTNDTVYGAANFGMSYWWINYDPNHAQQSPNPLPSGGSIKNFKVWNLWGTGIYGYQESNITIDGFVDVGSAAELVSGQSATCGMQFQDYFVDGLTVENSTIVDVSLGIGAPDSTGGPILIQNCLLECQTDYLWYYLWSVGYNAGNIPLRTVTLVNDQFVQPPSLSSFTAIDTIWYGTDQLANDACPITTSDKLIVENYDGVAGNNFQVFFSQQAANFVIPQSVQNSDGTYRILGSPVAGLTNAQAWAQYGIAVAGAVAPSDATTMANIIGLVAPI
jgi:hypothetical protein